MVFVDESYGRFLNTDDASMPEKSISFLLGAGFSKPAGYPLANGINKLFVGLGEGDFTIHTDGTAWFHNGNPNPNDWWMSKPQRLFAEHLLDHYCSEVIGASDFHYEKFYDWYKDLNEGREKDTGVEAIAADMDRRPYQLLSDFDRTFNQLLSQPLSKRFPEVHKARGLPRTHAQFLNLVEALSHEYILHFHSLNHDLFFESLSSTDAMQGELSDGFVELGSPYYGTFEDFAECSDEPGRFSYKVRLPHFANKFDTRFNLYKLHGSVDHFIFHDGEGVTIKNQRGVDTGNLLKEVERNGKLEYEGDISNYHPDFLSGTTYKTLQYDSTTYYEKIFKHFKANLEDSEALIAIGYGFRDEKINCLVEEHFLGQDNEAEVFIVDVSRPELPSVIDEASNFFDGGVSNFDGSQLLTSVLS